MTSQSLATIIAYHEIQTAKHHDVQAQGVLCGAASDKDTSLISKTNQFLDQHRPEQENNSLPSRRTAVYCYMAQGDDVVDITSGNLVSPKALITDDEHLLLRVHIHPEKTFVSDLDAFDAVKDAIEQDNFELAQAHALFYWQRITPFTTYRHGDIARPELMLTDDIPPSVIAPVKP